MNQVLDRASDGRLLSLMVCAVVAISAAADQVEMQNGDRYNGKVLSLNSESLVLQNEHLGTISLPRSKVTLINFGALAPPPAAVKEKPSALTGTTALTNRVPDLSGPLASLRSNSNLIQRVQKQYLAGAAPEAQDKFNELVSGLMSGKLTVEDVRAQAKATAEQVRASRKDLDESSRWAIDGYLAILDQFLGSADTAEKGVTNSAAPALKGKPADDE